MYHKTPMARRLKNISPSIFLYHREEGTPVHFIRSKKLKKLLVTYFVSGFTLKIAPFLFRCTTKPPRIEDTTFFLPFLFITIVKRALQYTIFNQKFPKNLHFYIFCAGFNFNFTHIFQICTTKPPRIDNTTFFK